MEFLDTQLIPQLTIKTIEYDEWWIFRPDSSLAKYIQKHHLDFNLYFRPTEIVALIENIAAKENLYGHGNYDVIFLNEELRKCFDTTSVYIPDLYKLCSSHVHTVNDTKSFILKNQLIKDEFYLDSPVNIIYSDPSSKFWIPRQLIHPYVCEDNQLVFTWKELCSKFLKFVSNPEITQMENSLFELNPNTVLAKQFNFHQFHKNQIPDILKKVVKFLGKSNTVLTLCSDLKFPHVGPHDPVVYWIEELIIRNNNLLPYVPSGIFL
jgi:hypothetical protein